MRLIDSDAVRDALYDADAITMKGVAIINQFPTIEAEPVVHGRWVIQRYYGGMRKGMVARVVCSECFTPNEETNYCPNCGAKMDGRSEGE